VKPIKLLVADVDGTLLAQDKALTARTRAAVDRLHGAGVELAITTSRPPRAMAFLVEPLKLTTPIAALDGAIFVKPDLKTVVEQRTLSLAVAIEVVDYLLQGGLDIWVYRGADWFIRNPSSSHVGRERDTVRFAPTVIENVRGVLDGAAKIVGVSDDTPLVARCEAELRQRIGAHALASRSQPYSLDVVHPDANKGMVVRLVSRLLQIPLDEVAAIGDMPDDVLMFGVAGIGIAMGNASSEVQRAARYVTGANEEEGFARAIDSFILRKPGAIQATLGLPPPTRACLFDLDGVLVQTAKIHAAAWKQMFDEFLREWSSRSGQPFVPFDPGRDYALYVDGKLRSDGARSFLASRGIELPESSIRDLAGRKDEIVLRMLERERVQTYDGSVRYVLAAREAGLRTAVVSSSHHTQQALASAGIADLFDVRIDGIVAAEQHLSGKPAPDTFLAAAHAVGVDPGQAVVFEDALSGVEAGRAGHFGYVVGVDRLDHAAELRQHGADVVVNDLADLLAPA